MSDNPNLEKILKDTEKAKPYTKKCKLKEWQKIYKDLEETSKGLDYLSKQELSPEHKQRFETLAKRGEDAGTKTMETVYQEKLKRKHVKDKILMWGPMAGFLGGIVYLPLIGVGYGVWAYDAFETAIKKKSGWRAIQGAAMATYAGFLITLYSGVPSQSFLTGGTSGLALALSWGGNAMLPLMLTSFIVGKGEKIRPPKKLPGSKNIGKKSKIFGLPPSEHMKGELETFARKYHKLMEKYKGKLDWVEGKDYEKEMFDLIDNWGLSEYFEDTKVRKFFKGGGPKKTMLVLGNHSFALGRANPISGKVHMYRDAMKRPVYTHVYFHELTHHDGSNESRCELESIRALSYLAMLFPDRGYDLEALLTEIRITGHTWAHQRKKELKKELRKSGLVAKDALIKPIIAKELQEMGFPIYDKDYMRLKDEPSPIHAITSFAFARGGMKALFTMQAIFQNDDPRCGYTIGAYRKLQLYKTMTLLQRGDKAVKEMKMLKEHRKKARELRKGRGGDVK